MDPASLCVLVVAELLGVGVIAWIVLPIVKGGAQSRQKQSSGSGS